MGEIERIAARLGTGSEPDPEALRRAVREQADEIDTLRQHMVAASHAVNAHRGRADETARSLAKVTEERAQAWAENERLRQALAQAEAENDRFRASIVELHAGFAHFPNGASAAAEELARIRASRWYRVMKAYHRLYDRPVLGPLLHRLRRLAGRVLRVFR